MSIVRTGALLAALTGLVGCSLPAAAPTSRELVSNQEGESFPFALVKVDSKVAFALRGYHTSFGPRFKKVNYVPKNSIKPGDSVAVTVYETGGSSLFPSPESRSASLTPVTTGTSASTAPSVGTSNTIPAQTVEADGTIAIPFMGRVKVAGLTPGQVGTVIEKGLSQKAVAPQVVVTMGSNASHAATVSGEVNAAKLVTLSLRGERVLDVIAAAGGAKYPAYESYVQVVRGGEVGTMLLQSIVSNASENIVIRPGDQVDVTRNPRTYVVMGATQRPSTFVFDREKITLAEAIAQAGGPIDSIGDPSGIYLFRFEPQEVARQIVEPEAAASLSMGASGFVPILYKIDMRNAEGYFLAQAIQMRDKDVVLITNADGVQLQKALQIVRGFTGIAYDLKRGYSW
jgi:polysaccharide export outer membrane protein